MIVLSQDFMDDSRQDEKISIEKYDRHGSESYFLKDNGVKFYLFSYMYYEDNSFEHLTPDIGTYYLTQYFPCDEGNIICLDSEQGYQYKDF